MILPQLPDEADGMTIAVLADIHADGMTNKKRVSKMVNLVNQQKPDVIVIAGDFADGSVKERADTLTPLTDLSAPLGVYGVPGNHEYYSGYEDWIHYLPALHIRMLLNENVILKNGVALAGVTDLQAQRFHFEGPDLKKAMSGIEHVPVKILLAHQPKTVDEAWKTGFDLQISGHTHGGMIWGFHYIVASANHGYSGGEYKLGSKRLYINRGSGIWNGFPVRLGIPSEITLLKLKKK